MRLLKIAAAAIALSSAAALAQDIKPPTVEQCLNILDGLNSLNCAGQQLNGQCPPNPADAKQYKLSSARITIGFDISQLNVVSTNAHDAQNRYLIGLPALPAADPGKPASQQARDDAMRKQTNDAQANWQTIIKGACPVKPGHLKSADLKIGDDDGQNAIPPSVLGAIYPIIDGLAN